ncbi:MAG: ABC transporter permease [Anaerolineales bacterium]|nr:ABC transporter permease [Anaerolineales bacterium]
MTRYIIRRLLQAIPLLLLISIVVFALMQAIPGGPLAAYENNPNIMPEDLERLKDELGLNVPVHQQYFNWLTAIVRGDWGTSLVTQRPALVEIGERLPNTLYLSVIAFIIALAISIPIGIISAVRQYSWFDHLMTTIAFMGHSIPVFWFGLVLIIIFNVTIKNPNTGGPLLPGGGMYTIGEAFSLTDRLTHLILPASLLVIHNLSGHVRYMRAGMLDVLLQDYIRTAHAKGLKERAVILKHALKNAVLPLVTIIGLEIPGLFNGALLTEIIFSWPGMGRLFFNSIERADYAVMMGVLMLSATLIIAFGLVTDIVYAFLDPRIRFD